jgi:membrane protease YdiL (CAAX protease family)
MKRSVLLYAALWGALFSVIVVLTNIVFPSPNESDDEYTGWYIVLYLGLFLLFAIGGALNSERARPLRSGAIGGAGAALIMIAMIMLTFVIVDNLFLDTVSQQIDKINAFQAQTTYTNMRDFINSGLLLGTLTVLPVVAVVGGGLGAIASLLRQRLTPTALAVA